MGRANEHQQLRINANQKTAMTQSVQAVCQFCGRKDAVIREEELETAAITGRAHVDCEGHAQYRALTHSELLSVRALQPGTHQITEKLQ
jgi:hypothetical protein